MVGKLEVDVEDGLPDVMMHAGKIEQVLINLLINAGEAADRRDVMVRLSVARQSDGVSIVVADDGPGMTPAVARRARRGRPTKRCGRPTTPDPWPLAWRPCAWIMPGPTVCWAPIATEQNTRCGSP